MGSDGETAKQASSNKGKHLLLFNDKSYSMHGAPFEALRQGCTGLGEQIFGESADQNLFESVCMIYYDDKSYPSVVQNKIEYQTRVTNERIGGSTNFVECIA